MMYILLLRCLRSEAKKLPCVFGLKIAKRLEIQTTYQCSALSPVHENTLTFISTENPSKYIFAWYRFDRLSAPNVTGPSVVG